MSFGEIISWPGEHVSVGLFVSGPTTQSGLAELFEAAFQEKPTQINENIQSNGRVGHAAAHNSKWAKVLAAQPGRFDISIQGSELNFSPSSPPPTFSDILDAINQVVEAAKRVAPKICESGYNRLAIHCRMAQFFRTIKEANQAIMKAVPPKLNLTDETDFLFQFNQKTKIDNFMLNRLIKWSVDDVQLIAATSVVAGLAPHQALSQFFSSAVHMDFNTMPSHMGHSAQQCSSMLDAISAEVVRVRKNGLRFKI